MKLRQKYILFDRTRESLLPKSHRPKTPHPNAHTEEELKQLAPGGVLPVDAPFGDFPGVSLSKAQSVRFKNGGELFTQRVNGAEQTGLYRVYSNEGEFLGLGEVSAEEKELIKARRVI